MHDIARMMDQNTEDNRKNKPRGRPAGALSYPEDLDALRKIARRLIHNPSAKFAALARAEGYRKDSEIRRLRKTWAKHKDTLLEEARARIDEHNSLGFIGELANGLDQLSDWVDRMARAFPTDAVRREITNAADKKRALEVLGKGPKPPFNVDDPVEVALAIARFERREHRLHGDLENAVAEQDQVDGPPEYYFNYGMALLFYEYALEAKAKERSDGRAVQDEDRPAGKAKEGE